MAALPGPELSAAVVDRLGVGVVTVDRELVVVQWNGFMAANTGLRAEEMIGRPLFDCFPELPRRWLEKKIRGVLVLGNFAFSSWRQRPYLFRFPHNRPVTGGVDAMRQDVTFIPIKDETGAVAAVCITIFDVTDASLAQLALEEMNIQDGLTGAFNRRYLDECLAAEFARFTRGGAPLSFVMFDLDHFKRVNDRFGHPAGDAVLRAIAGRARAALRATELLARYGGEEFAVVLPGATAHDALAVGERLRKAASASPVVVDGSIIAVTLSVGVSEARHDMAGWAELVKAADLALYACKTGGRNCVRAFVPAAEEHRGAA